MIQFLDVIHLDVIQVSASDWWRIRTFSTVIIIIF